MSSPCIRGKDKRNIFWVTFDWEIIQSRDNRVLISLLRSGNHQRVDIQHAGHRNRGVVQSLLHGETMPAVRLPNQVTRHDRWWIRLPTPRKVQDPFDPLPAPPPSIYSLHLPTLLCITTVKFDYAIKSLSIKNRSESMKSLLKKY